ncbi:adhesion G-protein coupled receptor G1 isoform X2 [Thunnus maccoyii]|uniref:adhesion G-protein coupled receptor G1 isoform X2 n=1 Tax=Thunnus maccoyii TaxID=8240 RepID=UPI001C4CBFD3|nr:adhesion G-protein coupled receptor G1 isoform X2 [Thunnus maccoyii]
MELRLTNTLRAGFILIILHSTFSSENDWDFCGTWRHGSGSLSLNINLSTGCNQILISANESSLSISGQITAQCARSEVILLNQYGLDSRGESHFCLYWEPLRDQMKLQVGGENFILCEPIGLPDSCCSELSNDQNFPEATYGIVNGMIKSDLVTDKTLTAYVFNGTHKSCKTLCPNTSQEDNMLKNTPCARSSEVEMKEDFRGYNITSPVMKDAPPESVTSVHLPPALKQAAKNNKKVVCTFFKNNSLFQEGHKEGIILNDVVGITVENEVIRDLPEPIKISFHHDVIPKTHSRKCVSWDTRKDPMKVNWLVDGCETQGKGPKHTECHCDHMTYFSVLVQLEARPVRHLLALTTITSLGCAVSVISCIALIIFLFRRRRSNEQSIPIHLGLAVSLTLLNLLFFFTGILANVGGQGVCVWVGAALHYALLSSFVWMGIEVFHTFWLVCMVFNPSPKPYIWNLVGYILPAVPIIILAAVGDVYGVREVVPSDDVSNPYLMCWMKNNKKAWLAHYFTNMTVLAILVISGIVMLVLVYREIHTRNEWKQNRVAFLSIWGLSCLFGTTWGLTFLDFTPLSDCILFLSCILNSFQGFLLMLRFYMLDWMRKQAGGSGLGSTSTGSTRHHMLQEKS